MRVRLVLLVLAIWFSCVALTWAVTHLVDRASHTAAQSSSNCQQIELLKASIRASVAQTTKTLGQPGTAGYAYYHVHPQELHAALEANRAILSNFAPKPC